VPVKVAERTCAGSGAGSLSIRATTPRQRWSCQVAAFVRGTANVASLVMVVIVMASFPSGTPNRYSAGCDVTGADMERL
jgi:hypothetical protein